MLLTTIILARIIKSDKNTNILTSLWFRGVTIFPKATLISNMLIISQMLHSSQNPNKCYLGMGWGLYFFCVFYKTFDS